MTMNNDIEIPDWDPELVMRPSVPIEGTCHAITVTYTIESEVNIDNTTHCGINVNEENISIDDSGMRKEFLDLAMCEECWPNEVIANE